jgi:transcriptional regulator with XRE-family HTH domain/Zn-dependent peptidase ImmA (M78 family)
MEKSLNIPNIKSAMQQCGLSQAKIATEIGVSRSAVTNWLKNSDFPRPAKLLKLGGLLQLSFTELVIEQPEPNAPVVAFRKKKGRKTKDTHLERAMLMGGLLQSLAPLLPFDDLSAPPTLKDPKNEYEYLQRLACQIRGKIGVGTNNPIHPRDLIGTFASLQAVIIPVLWGHQSNHENALHIYLPDSMTTWVYLNLDSNSHDFMFWMAHELGHVYASKLRDEAAEDFADSFAQTLLFPEACAQEAYASVKKARNEGGRINRIKDYAEKFGISPTTVNLALSKYAENHDAKHVDVGEKIHAASTNFNKNHPTLSQNLFGQPPPSAKEYIDKVSEVFQTSFFEALQKRIQHDDASSGIVTTLLQLPLLDAKEIWQELR